MSFHFPNMYMTDFGRRSDCFWLCKIFQFCLYLCFGPLKWCVYVKLQHASTLTTLRIKQTLQAFSKSLGLSYFYLAQKVKSSCRLSLEGTSGFRHLTPSGTLVGLLHSQLWNTRMFSTNTWLRLVWSFWVRSLHIGPRAGFVWAVH